AASFYDSSTWKEFFLAQTSRDLAVRARLLSRELAGLLDPMVPEGVDRMCKQAGPPAGTRFTVIADNGRVAGDSEENPALMDSHADRPEVHRALGGRTGTSVRFSRTLGKDMMYVAVPVMEGGRLLAVVRAAVPLTSVDAALGRVRSRMAWASVLIAFAAAAVSYLVSRRISRPVAEMREGAERFAAGELSHRLPEPATFEMARLAGALNRMAEELARRIGDIERQSAEYQAVLSSMREGVVAVDAERKVIQANAAAEEMLGAGEPFVPGKSIQEMVRHPRLFDLLEKTLEDGTPGQEDIALLPPSERVVNVSATLLGGLAPGGRGARR
ncbi:MAG: HAMP domain-containing protein, partial [Thermodesulfobacteriota bacterium]